MKLVQTFDGITVYKLNNKERLAIKNSPIKNDNWPIAKNPRYVIFSDSFSIMHDWDFEHDIQCAGFYGAFETYREAYFFIKLDSALNLLNHIEIKANEILGNDESNATTFRDSLNVDFFSLPDYDKENAK